MEAVKDARYWIARLGLRPHPEGGYFVETYRAAEEIPHAALPARFTGPRAFATAILFLLEGDQVSTLHRLRSDELWHYHAGGSATIHIIEPDGAYRTVGLGPDLERGASFQAAVPPGCWFGATVDDARSFTLVGCTVSPGFSFDDFEPGDRQRLIEACPQHASIITRLTKPR